MPRPSMPPLSPSTTPPAAIAVVGIACHYPGARSPRELWENVLSRRQEFRPFLEERMPAQDYHDPDPSAPDRTYGSQGAFLDGFSFDPNTWRVPRSTFAATDVTHWLALDVAAKALADAGHPAGEGLPRERVGVIVGNSLTGEIARANSLRLRWPFVRRLVEAEARRHLPAEEVNRLVDAIGERYRDHFPPTTEDTLAGALSNTIAGRICGVFDLGGGGYVVDGACASSMLAVCTAAQHLEDGKLDVALAGGVDVSMDPFELVGFAKARALSPTEMRVYDRRGDGFIPGEGCAFVVLKRLEDARAAGDRVYAVVTGWGVSSDGRNAITAPKVSGQARAIRAAWSRAGVPDFVEGHGTGTAVGDKVELTAIAEAAGGAGARSIGVTSLKSLIGHTKAAAGIGAFIKAVVAVNRRVLPPLAGCGEPNPVFDEAAGALFPIRLGEVRGAEEVLRAGASAMGFGGINSHAVVISADPPDTRLAPSVPEAAALATAQESELFVLGAATLAEVRAEARALSGRSEGMAIGALVDLAADTLRRLPRRPTWRAAILASSPKELRARLKRLEQVEAADGPEIWLGAPTSTPRLGFLFPGQGSQEVDAARVLVARHPHLAAEASSLADAAAEAGCPDLLSLLYPPADRAVTPAEAAEARARLTPTEIAQPALCLSALLWTRRLADLGLEPTVVAGHSLGELTAFAAAGAIDGPTLLRLAARRGQAMAAPAEASAAGAPGMVSLATDTSTAEALCVGVPGFAAVANVNTPHQVVVAADAPALAALLERAGARQIPARKLPVSNGFHSELVAGAAEALRHTAPVPAEAAPPRATLLSTLQEAPITAGHPLADHVASHVRRPVDFVALTRRLAPRADLLVEVGPGRVLSGLVDATLGAGGPRCLPVEAQAGRAADLNAVLAAAWTRGTDVIWQALHTGRIVRPFVPRAELRFIPNPCEVGREPAADASVRAPLPPAAEAPRPAPASPPVDAPTARPPEVLDRLRALVAETTGFALESIPADARLRDDLNLDSIKAGEVVAKLARELGVAGRIDPAQIVAHPLQEIAGALAGIDGARLGGAATGGDRPAAAQASEAPAAVDGPARWVRTFGLRRVGCAPPTGASWEGARVRLVASGAEGNVLRGALLASGALVGEGGDHVVALLSARGTAARVVELTALVGSLGAARGVTVIQRVDGALGLGAPADASPANAFWRAVSLERGDLAVRVLDVAPALCEQGLRDALGGGRRVDAGFEGLGLGADGWSRLEARPLAMADAPARPGGLDRGDLVLVTGGARGITAELATALAVQTGARLALVGSTPREKVDGEILQTLGRLALHGIEARYWACDLADGAAVRRMVEEVRSVQGPIVGVLHGAGRNSPRRVEQVDAEAALAEIAPKLLGAEALLAALEDAPPRLLIALTSIIGVSGMAGNAWYAWANESLDLAVARFAARHPSCTPLCLAYGVWREVGMGAKLGSVSHLARLGIGALDPAEGVARFLELVRKDPGCRQPIVTAHLGGLPTWPAPFPTDPALRFLDGEVSGVLGVEARLRLTLHPDRDRWLRDHDFRGSLLLPTVFGLEAFAQVAWLVTGGEGEVTDVYDIDLPAPVVVAPGGTVVELSASLDEADPLTVRCELRTEQTGFGRAHFSARLRLAGALPLAQEHTLPTLTPPTPRLLPHQDLYGGLLFQGPAFHRMGEITGGEGRSMVFSGEVGAPADARWVLGDPFFRDALLQAGQVLVAQDEALPVHIRHLGLARGHAAAGVHQVHASILRSTERRHEGAVTVVDGAGRRVQWLEGYEVQVLSHHPERPDTAEILRPGGGPAHQRPRLRERLVERLEHLAGARSLAAPVIGLFEGPQPGPDRASRHQHQHQLVGSMLPTATLDWSPSGAPQLTDGRGISLSHDDGGCLVVVSPGRVGCDLEPIRDRGQDGAPRDWEGLLGAARLQLLPALQAGGDDRATAATRVWSATEALHKAGLPQATPHLAGREGDAALFTAGDLFVWTWPLHLARGPVRMVAVALPAAPRASTLAEAPASLLPPDLLHARMVRGEGEQPDHLETHFVVAFDESGSLSGKVPAVTLATWMGRLRELALTGLARPISQALESGEHGMVTQNAWVHLTGEATALDRIQARTWVEDLRPGTCLLRFQFWRLTADGRREELGHAAQRFGWVEVLGHGQVRAAAFPPFLMSFLTRLHKAGPVPTPRPLLLPVAACTQRVRVSTGLMDGNVVGNLYYAHYFKWAQRAVDTLLWRRAPDVLRGRGQLGELILRGLRLEYLREAMPFDEIDVSLHRAVSTGGEVAFDVVYERVEAEGPPTRLALGRVEGVWHRGLGDRPLPWAANDDAGGAQGRERVQADPGAP